MTTTAESDSAPITASEPHTLSFTTPEPEPNTASNNDKEPEPESVKDSAPESTSVVKSEPETVAVIEFVEDTTPLTKPENIKDQEPKSETRPIVQVEAEDADIKEPIPETPSTVKVETEANSVAIMNAETEFTNEHLEGDTSVKFPPVSDPPHHQLYPQDTTSLVETGLDTTTAITTVLNPSVSEQDASKIHIHVTSPVKHTVNGILPGLKSSYHTYLINTTTSLPTFNQGETAVRRRFREFVDLGDLLKVNFCGFFVPPRPHRNWYQAKVLQRKKFIEERRVLLERYLRALAAHPKISTSTELRVFLESRGNLSDTTAWRALHEQGPTLRQMTSKTFRQISGRERITPDASEISRPQSLNRNVMWVIGGSMKNLDRNRQSISYSTQEQTLRDERTHLLNFKTEVKTLWKRASVWIEGIEKMAIVCKNLAFHLNALTRFETDARYVRLDTPSIVAKGVDQASEVYALCLKECTRPLSVIHNYVEMMQSVLGALTSREKALKNVHLIDQAIIRKQSKLGQLREKPAKSERISKLEADIEEDRKTLFEAKKFYEHVTIINVEEADRFRTTRAEDWMKMIVQIAQIQHKCYVQLSKVWIGISEKLGTDPKDLVEIKAVVKST